MDISPLHATGSIVIGVPPEVVFDFIADMPAMGHISSQCVGGEWQSEKRGVGALFLGSNDMGGKQWQALMRVVVADRPHEFAWENVGAIGWDGTAFSRWGYTFEPVEGGTKVEETWRILHEYDALVNLGEEAWKGMPGWFAGDIANTLANLKTRLEQSKHPVRDPLD
jgi:Polyketide cyclase / dehydrase and lipid transport